MIRIIRICVQERVQISIQQHSHQDKLFTTQVLLPCSEFDGILECSDQCSQLNLFRSTCRKTIPNRFVNGRASQNRVVRTRWSLDDPASISATEVEVGCRRYVPVLP